MEKYSVLMSVYYKENPKWFKESIDSMLKQTIFPNEFVIVKDGVLTKELEKVISNYLKKYPKLFKIISLEKNVGLGKALSIGVEKCKNKFIARMDSDDYSVPNRIEKQFEIFKRDKELSIVGSNVLEFEGSIKNTISLVKLPETSEEIYSFSKKRCPFRHPSLLYKKEAIMSIENYRHYPYFEDYDLYVRLLKSGFKGYNIQEPLTYMRINDNFYKRRGGLKYLKSILKFKNEQYKSKYFNFKQYISSTIPHVIVCLTPNFLRKFIYKKFLRKKGS